MARMKKAEKEKIENQTETTIQQEELNDAELPASFYDYYEATEEEIADGRRKETLYTRWPEGMKDLGIVQFKGPWGEDVIMGRVGLSLVIDWDNNIKVEVHKLAPTKRYHKTGVLHDETTVYIEWE